MKKFLAVLVLASIGLWATNQVTAQEGDKPTSQPAKPEAPAGLETLTQRASYTIGYRMGQNFSRQGGDVDLEQFMKGLEAGLAGKASALDDKAMFDVMREYQKVASAKAREAQAKLAEKNKAEGVAWLAENAKKEGVTVLPSGLQFSVIATGEGPKPTAQDKVKVHYHGTLIDGTVFDSSVQRGQPASFPVTGVIKGWVEALQLMTVGSKWKLFIPSDLAYGANPRPGGPIGPNAVLVFEVELLEIVK